MMEIELKRRYELVNDTIYIFIYYYIHYFYLNTIILVTIVRSRSRYLAVRSLSLSLTHSCRPLSLSLSLALSLSLSLSLCLLPSALALVALSSFTLFLVTLFRSLSLSLSFSLVDLSLASHGLSFSLSCRLSHFLSQYCMCFYHQLVLLSSFTLSTDLALSLTFITDDQQQSYQPTLPSCTSLLDFYEQGWEISMYSYVDICIVCV